VDKETQTKMRVEVLYNRGGRAYIVDNAMIFQYPEYYKYADGTNLTTWHALRAYQDEQRKKGEPIRFDAPLGETYLPWNRRTYGEFWFGSRATRPGEKRQPVIEVFSFDHAHILKNQIARFTNFRWKPGHGPKKEVCGFPVVKHEGLTDLVVVYPEKGGSNG
jgi:hypothetical protein